MKRERRRQAARQSQVPLDEAWPTEAEAIAWTDGHGLHTLVPGEAPTPNLTTTACPNRATNAASSSKA
jgi:hypothetical protein